MNRVLLSALSLLSALGSVAPGNAQATGVLQGHLKIVSLQTVQPADGSEPTVTTETYGEFPLVVLNSDGKRLIAVLTADANGNYRVELPPGTYVLDIENRVRKHVRAKPVLFTVVSGQSVHMNMVMDTGIR